MARGSRRGVLEIPVQNERHIAEPPHGVLAQVEYRSTQRRLLRRVPAIERDCLHGSYIWAFLQIGRPGIVPVEFESVFTHRQGANQKVVRSQLRAPEKKNVLVVASVQQNLHQCAFPAGIIPGCGRSHSLNLDRKFRVILGRNDLLHTKQLIVCPASPRPNADPTGDEAERNQDGCVSSSNSARNTLCN